MPFQKKKKKKNHTDVMIGQNKTRTKVNTVVLCINTAGTAVNLSETFLVLPDVLTAMLSAKNVHYTLTYLSDSTEEL